MFKITRSWLEDYVMKGGIGINRDQCKVLGVSSLKRGWKDDLIGSVITLEQKELAEAYRGMKPAERKRVRKEATAEVRERDIGDAVRSMYECYSALGEMKGKIYKCHQFFDVMMLIEKIDDLRSSIVAEQESAMRKPDERSA